MWFATALLNLKVSSPLGRGDKIEDDVYITNDHNPIKKLIDKEISLAIGGLEIEFLLNSDSYIYSVRRQPDDLDPQRQLRAYLGVVTGFLNTIWFFHDSSVNNELGFLVYLNNSIFQVDSNFHARTYSTSVGKRETLTLSRSQLQDVRRFYRDVIGAGLVTDENPFDTPTTKLSKDTSRTTRAFYLMQRARAASDLGIKVADYCSSFEALFSSDARELSHQLCERVAFFLGKSADERFYNYRQLKRAYDIRSQIVHGSPINQKKINELPEVSKCCDALLRQCMKKIVDIKEIRNSFNLSNDKFNSYMLATIFGTELNTDA
jgi:hypothetical protein